MANNKIIEYIFFFTILGAAAFMVWSLFSPFLGSLTLSAIIVTVCYPLYERVLKIVPRHNKSVASLLSVLLVIFIVVLPLAILGSFIFREALSVYSLVNSATYVSFTDSLSTVQEYIQKFIPGFSINISSFIEQIASFIATHLVSLFTATASTIFLFFIALIGSFYFFRDGKEFTSYLVKISPLKDTQDELIIRRLATSIRSVAIGTILVALIQGTLTAIGLSLFGFERGVLWGCIAAMGALIPGVGTSIVFIPAILYLLFTGQHLVAGGVALWGALAVGIVDNVIGPYLMSRGNSLHPFLILLSVLGGISLFGPIGFILGPVVLSLFTVLLELYSTYIQKN